MSAKPLSGIYAAMIKAGASHRLTVVKVKGHVAPSTLPAGTAPWKDACGNRAADAAAREGAQHRVFTAELTARMQACAAIATAAVAIGDAIWHDWPELGRFDQYARAPAADPAPRPQVYRHRWIK